jgi:hypothetical protein
LRDNYPQQPAAAHRRRKRASVWPTFRKTAAEALASGRLVRVLADWTPPSPATISTTPARASIPALSPVAGNLRR